MLKFLFCTNEKYAVCTIFRLEKEKKLCYHIYNKEEIRQKSKNQEKSDNQNQIICDRNEKIRKLRFQKMQDPQKTVRSNLCRLIKESKNDFYNN